MDFLTKPLVRWQVALAQRLYDVQGGQVLLDSTDVRRLQVKWLRSHIGVVSQEPVRARGLLSCSTVFQRKFHEVCSSTVVGAQATSTVA